MDAQGKILWDATLARAGEHDRAVVEAHNTVNEPEVAAYWIDWNKFKASLKDLSDKIDATFSVVLDSDIQVKDAELNALISDFNALGPRIRARQLDIDTDLLLLAIDKQKRGEKLTDEEIAAIAKYTAQGSTVLIRDSPVKPSLPSAPEGPTPSFLSAIPWPYKAGAAAALVLLAVVAVRK